MLANPGLRGVGSQLLSNLSRLTDWALRPTGMDPNMSDHQNCLETFENTAPQALSDHHSSPTFHQVQGLTELGFFP